MTKILGLTSDDKIVPVTVDADGHLQIDLKSITSGSNLIGRVDARDGDKIWSFSDVLLDAKDTYNLSAGNGNIGMTHVPAGEIWKIYEWGIKALQINCTDLILKKHDGTSAYNLKTFKSWTAGVTVFLGHSVILKEGEYLQLRYLGASENDGFEMIVTGYIMTI